MTNIKAVVSLFLIFASFTLIAKDDGSLILDDPFADPCNDIPIQAPSDGGNQIRCGGGIIIGGGGSGGGGSGGGGTPNT